MTDRLLTTPPSVNDWRLDVPRCHAPGSGPTQAAVRLAVVRRFKRAMGEMHEEARTPGALARLLRELAVDLNVEADALDGGPT